MTTSKGKPDTPDFGNQDAEREAIDKDRADQRAARRSPAARRAFGLIHGALAIEHPAVTTLRMNSPERDITIEAISLYPDVKRTGSKGRCDVAVDTALDTIPELRKYVNDEDAVKRARIAVKAAFGFTNIAAKARARALGDA